MRRDLNVGTKALLAAAGLFAVAGPIAIGLLDGVTLRAQAVSPALTFEVASVRLAPPRMEELQRADRRGSLGLTTTTLGASRPGSTC